MQWRNTALDFSSLGALQATLAVTPEENGLSRAPVGEDIVVLEHAGRDDDVRGYATTRETIERLWEVSTPLLESPPPVRFYAPASWGPNAIHQLIAPRAWRLPFERSWRDSNRNAG